MSSSSEYVSEGTDNLEATANKEELLLEANHRFQTLKDLLPGDVKKDIHASENVIIDLGAGRARTGTLALAQFVDNQKPVHFTTVDAASYDDAESTRLRKESTRYLIKKIPMVQIEDRYGETFEQFGETYDKSPQERANVVLLSQVESSPYIDPSLFNKLVKPGGYVVELGIGGNVQGLEQRGFEKIAETDTDIDRDTKNRVWRLKTVKPLR